MRDDLDEGRLYRGGGIAGLSAIVILLLSLPLAPPWPPPSAGAAGVVSYFSEHRTGFLWQAFVATTGVSVLIPFAASLAALLRANGRTLSGGTVFGAMLVFVGAFEINWIPWVVIAFRPEHPPEVKLALYDFGLLGQFIGVGAPLAVLFGAIAAGTRDGAVLPRWLAILSAVSVPLNLLLAGCTAPSGPLAPNGPVGFASIGLFTVFGLGASIAMIRRGRRSTRAA